MKLMGDENTPDLGRRDQGHVPRSQVDVAILPLISSGAGTTVRESALSPIGPSPSLVGSGFAAGQPGSLESRGQSGSWSGDPGPGEGCCGVQSCGPGRVLRGLWEGQSLWGPWVFPWAGCVPLGP